MRRCCGIGAIVGGALLCAFGWSWGEIAWHRASAAEPPRERANADDHESGATKVADQSDLRAAEVRDIHGYSHNFGDFITEPAEAVVVAFCHPDCPVVRQYVPRLIELHKHYNGFRRDRTGMPLRVDAEGRETAYNYPGDRVAFYAVYSTADFGLRAMAAHAFEARLPFRPLLDARQQLLKALGGTTLGEVVLLDAKGTIRYQGMIDDQYFRGGRKPAARQHYLREAIDAVLAGHDPATPRRPAQGCRISDFGKATGEGRFTFHEHVEPILQQRCQECHRPGMVGPMPLTTFDEARAFGAMIAEVVHDQRMPPWPADSPRKLARDRRLSADERETIVAWVREGMPRGNPASAPPGIDWPPANQWKIGEPDFVFEMPEAFPVPAEGVVDYVYYPIKVGLPGDKYIQAVETVPGDPAVVHHIQVMEYKGKVAGPERLNLTPVEQLLLYGLTVDGAQLIGNYTPGSIDNARTYPLGQGVKLSRGANLMLELHYTPNGKATRDRSKVGIKFADVPPEKQLKTQFFFRKRGDFVIPAGVQHHSMQHLYHFERPVRILALRPHLHLRGKSYRLERVASEQVRLADVHDLDAHDTLRGEVLLTVPAWDFNWQLTYTLEEPLVIRRGEALLATGYWDNSQFNPRNPDPTRNVAWGLQTHHEMFHTMFLYEELDDNDPLLTQAVSAADKAAAK